MSNTIERRSLSSSIQKTSFRSIGSAQFLFATFRMMNSKFPPNSIVRTDGYYRLTRNARIDAFQPHMHMRGRGMTLEAINLDNTTTVLSSVDHFNFNWHINYIYADDSAPLL